MAAVPAPDEKSIELTASTRDAMHDLGRRLAGTLRPGDLVVLTGDLGAGKTTLTQGIGAGLGVRGPVTSPTFVIARVHPSERGGPALVHVDAYRLGSIAEVDDLDLDASLEDSVTVVEWGEGLVDDLASDRLHVAILRPHGAATTVDGGTVDGAVDGATVDGVDGVDGADVDDERDDERDDVDDDERDDVDDEDDVLDEPRRIRIRGIGERWSGIQLEV
ncbi:tRNA (adenosine(37)-N6)-threonylcarbamoyltransferase complex ATPase subunit type 1 TsaE [Angustibacter sp. McL0619]|uniref:tRNA (adenosine(37)-N6)-threonylcarbamoyltransferase complex ATPase subunit type 1 TsaE n=1 Tax=Angustibacter sp. McL0619 TaxID=3415676 RepID=UPI003CF7B523